MNQKGIVLSGLIYVLLAFFLLLLVSLLAVLWYRQNASDALRKDVDDIYDEPYIPSDKTVFDFAYTGDYQTFTVPVSGTYKIELWGAQGSSNGGKGGYTEGEIYLDGASILYIYVGGTPIDVLTAGYNGGGAGLYSNGANRGGSGGGATDIRLVNGLWDNVSSLRSRIMVAGGGGGQSTFGGAAGGLIGVTGTITSGAANAVPGTGGTQTSGGASGSVSKAGTGTNGTFGKGADASPGTSTDLSGAGGGGYYGGGNGYDSDVNAGGGGGSSFISGYTGCNAINSSGTHTGGPNHYSGLIFTNATMIAGNTSMSSPTGTIEVGHTGNGYAKITYIP